MSDPDQTLQSIDDTLEQWDQWNGHSPDAARWAGEPDESEWSDQRLPSEHSPEVVEALQQSWRRIVHSAIDFGLIRQRLCCQAGAVAFPEPCLWHGRTVEIADDASTDG